MPSGIMIKAVLIGGLIIAMLTGINIPLIILDIILKLINVISGNAFFSSIFSQAFDPSNPIFIIYISIFLISFVLSLLFIIKESLRSTMNHSAFREKNRNKTMIHKWKWLGFWAIGFIIVPSGFFLMNFIVSQISGIFGSGFFGINILTGKDWLIYENLLIKKIDNLNTNINNWLLALENIDPALDYDANLINILKTKLDMIQKSLHSIREDILKIFDTGILNIDQLKVVQNLFLGLDQQITDLNSAFAANGALYPLIDLTNLENINYLNIFIDSYSGVNNIVIGNFEQINNKSLSIGNFIIRGINGNVTGAYIPEPLTIELSKLIYGYELWELFPPSLNNVGGSFGPSQLVKLIISALFNVLSILFSITKFLQMFLGTFFVAVILSSFIGIALMLAKRTFEFIGLILISPVVIANGINDSGSKFELWFKNILGKQLLVLSVAFTISIFNMLVSPILIASDSIFKSIDIFGPISGNAAFVSLLIFKGLMLIASSIAMVEFIQWLNTILNAESKIMAVGKGMMKKGSGSIDSFVKKRENAKGSNNKGNTMKFFGDKNE